MIGEQLDMFPHCDFDDEIWDNLVEEMANALNGSTVDLHKALQLIFPNTAPQNFKNTILNMDQKTYRTSVLGTLRALGPSLETVLSGKKRTV